MTEEYECGDIVWFVHKDNQVVYECVIQEYIDGYYYAFANDYDGRTMLMPVHVDNLRDNEESAKKELFKLRLQKEKVQR